MAARYDEQSIRVLKGLEAVRLRPGMYVADTGAAGLIQLTKEVVDNSVDEHQAGHCSEMKVEVWTKGKNRNKVRVSDNGRGIPVGKHKDAGMSTLTVVFCMLHAGGKFDDNAYKTSAGLHGVGVKATNALSESLSVVVRRDGKKYRQTFEKGVPTSKVKKIGTSKKNGTTVTFKHDPEIFGNIDIDPDSIKSRLIEVSYLCPELNVEFEVDGTPIKVNRTGGIKRLLKDDLAARNVKTMHKPVLIKYEDTYGDLDIEVELAIAWTQGQNDRYHSFVNVCRVPQGGTQVTGFKSAVSKVLSKEVPKVPREYLRDGLVVVSHIRHPDPMFKSQSKDALLNKDARGAGNKAMIKAIKKAFKANPDLKDAIITRAKALRDHRKKLDKMMDAVRNIDLKPKRRGVLPDKLAEATEATPWDREIYLVEGDSAGGTAETARNPKKQEVLALRGKVPNAVRSSPDQILKNKEYLAIISAVGCGIDGIGMAEEDGCDPINKGRVRADSKAKICLLMDADPDGQHIASLLLSFFVTYMRPVVDAGMVYVIDSPLFVGVWKDKRKQGHTVEEVLKQFPDSAKPDVTRLKGHGGASPEQLADYAFGPKRKMFKLVVSDDSDADSVAELMGADASVRRRLLGL